MLEIWRCIWFGMLERVGWLMATVCLPVTRYLIAVYQSTVRNVLEDWIIQLLLLFTSQFDIAEVGPV